MMEKRGDDPVSAESEIETQTSDTSEIDDSNLVWVGNNVTVVSSNDQTVEVKNLIGNDNQYVKSSIKASPDDPALLPALSSHIIEVVEEPTSNTNVVIEDNPLSFHWKYNEGEYLQQIEEYVKSTYGEHYAHDVSGVGMQVFDLWEGLDSLETTARDTALKYLVRYGRKGGYNKKDILKAIHYSILLLYATRDK